MYEYLRKDGISKEKAARIASAKAVGTLDHDSTHLEKHTTEKLYDEARVIGIRGAVRDEQGRTGEGDSQRLTGWMT